MNCPTGGTWICEVIQRGWTGGPWSLWESYTLGNIHKILVQSEGKTHMDLFFLALILTNVRFEWQDFETWRRQTWPAAFFEDNSSLPDWEEPIQAPLKSLESQDFKMCPESCNRTWPAIQREVFVGAMYLYFLLVKRDSSPWMLKCIYLGDYVYRYTYMMYTYAYNIEQKCLHTYKYYGCNHIDSI